MTAVLSRRMHRKAARHRSAQFFPKCGRPSGHRAEQRMLLPIGFSALHRVPKKRLDFHRHPSKGSAVFEHSPDFFFWFEYEPRAIFYAFIKQIRTLSGPGCPRPLPRRRERRTAARARGAARRPERAPRSPAGKRRRGSRSNRRRFADLVGLRPQRNKYI